MKYFIVSVRDRAADVFGAPQSVVNIGGAIRAFGDEANRADANNQIYKHPEDFDLYQLGEYDDNTGLFECGAPKQIARAQDFKKTGSQE